MNQWTVAPPEQWEILRHGHDAIVGEGTDAVGVRRLVAESWRRSLALALNPDVVLATADLSEADLRSYREAHPLSIALPTIHRLLIRHAFDAGLIVAVGDEAGRLLWIDGDRALRRKAEGMMFIEGADWSERRVGTSAPGTALALDHGVQIAGPEHFTRIVHPWSCTAVPVHDPYTGAVLGVIDVTGGENAVAPATLPLMEAAVAAVEAELLVHRLDAQVNHRRVVRTAVLPAPVFRVLGTDIGKLDTGANSIAISERHSEILVLLSTHPEGLTAERLADLLYDGGGSVATLRPEMVRLRKELGSIDPSLVPLSRPYRLPKRLELDAQRVLGFLDRGAHRVALGGYCGPVLPTSTAPGIVALRDDVRHRLREALLADASAETLLEYARTDEAEFDVEVWRACLRLLPARSPKRTSVILHLERIDEELRNSAQPSDS